MSESATGSAPNKNFDQDNAQSVLLNWLLEEGQVLQLKSWYERKTQANQTDKTIWTYDYQWIVDAVKDSGEVEFSVQVDRVRIHHEGDLGPFDFDSLTDKPESWPEEKRDSWKWAMEGIVESVGRTHHLIRKPDGVLSEVPDGDKHGITKLLAPGAWLHVPDHPVKVGQRWQSDEGKYKVDVQLESLEKHGDHQFARLRSQNAQYEILFDVTAKRPLEFHHWFTYRYEIKDKESHDSEDDISTTEATDSDGTEKVYGIRNIATQHRVVAVDGERTEPVKPIAKFIDEGRARHALFQSVRHTDSMEEYLLDEKSMLSLRQQWLYMELGPAEFPEPSDHWQPMDWLMASRIAERQGDLEKSRNLLKQGVERVANANKPGIVEAIFLLQVSQKLASLGEAETAMKAAMAIQESAMAGLNFTATSVVQIPEKAMRDYALLLVTCTLAEQGNFEQAKVAMDRISLLPPKECATWSLASQLASHQQADEAFLKMQEAIEIAKEIQQKRLEPQVNEFTFSGPFTVPTLVYRELAISQVATTLATQDDRPRVEKSLYYLPDPADENSALFQIAQALEADQHIELADLWCERLPEPIRSGCWNRRMEHRLARNDLQGARQAIDRMGSKEWQVYARLRFCESVEDEDNDTLIKQFLSQSLADIFAFQDPQQRLLGLYRLSQVLYRTGDSLAAREILTAAWQLSQKTEVDSQETFLLKSIIASELAARQPEKFVTTAIETLRADLSKLGPAQHPSAHIKLVDVAAAGRQYDQALKLAQGISDDFERCAALAFVGHSLAQDLEVVRSREVFGQAYQCALQVDNLLGIDTRYCVGGAIRWVAQRQGEVDVVGLTDYLEAESDANPNILAYGWLGCCETMAPEAASIATRKGDRFQKGFATHWCQSNVACQIRTQLNQQGPLMPPWLGDPNSGLSTPQE